MSVIPSLHKDGDISVGRHVSIGGDSEIAGKQTVHHDLKVEGWLRAPNVRYRYEDIIRMLGGSEIGDTAVAETDMIESMRDNGDNSYTLRLHRKWSGYVTGIQSGDVIKGDITGKDGKVTTCWLRVNSVDTSSNSINATPYPDAEVPEGVNHSPTEYMRLQHWGNQTDPKRQSCVYISSSDGRIILYTGVTKPIIDEDNYGCTIGTIPDEIKDYGLPEGDSYGWIYARGLIVRDFIQLDKKGNPLINYVDRGIFDPTADYYNATLNPETGLYETSEVWYMGCRYRCMKTGTHSTPGWGNTDWALLEGDPGFKLVLEGGKPYVNPRHFKMTLTLHAYKQNQEITDSLDTTDIVWARYSEDAYGNARTASDKAWGVKRGKSGKELELTEADIDMTDGLPPRVCTYICTVTFREKTTGKTVTKSARFKI